MKALSLNVCACILPLVLSSAQCDELGTTLADYLSEVVEVNYEIRQQRAQESIAMEGVNRERAMMTPTFVLSTTYAGEERENTAEQARSQLQNVFVSETDVYSAGVEGLISTGGRYRVSYVVRKLNNNLNNFEDEFATFAGLELRQPLLKNGGKDAALAKLRLAETESLEGHQLLRAQVMRSVSQAESAYWDLVLAQEQATIRRESVEVAKKLLADTTEWQKAGRLTELDVFHARVGLGLRQARLEEATDQHRTAVNRARTLIGVTAGGDEVPLVFIDKPATAEALTLKLDDAVAAALAQHPEYLSRVQQLEKENIRLKYAKDQTRPQLDLVATAGLNGLGSSLGQSHSDVGGIEYENWSIGVEFSIPLGANPADADHRAAVHREEQASYALRAVKSSIVNAIDTAMRRTRTTAARVRHMEEIVDYNRQVLKVERTRLENGRSDSRKVLEIEEELGAALNSRWEAVISYQKTILELYLHQGLLLDRHDLNVLPAATR